VHDSWLAEAHRRLAEAERSLERRMLEQAEALRDPENMRQRARAISRNARKHEEMADRIERRSDSLRGESSWGGPLTAGGHST
jgi:hypothetical protein